MLLLASAWVQGGGATKSSSASCWDRGYLRGGAVRRITSQLFVSGVAKEKDAAALRAKTFPKHHPHACVYCSTQSTRLEHAEKNTSTQWSRTSLEYRVCRRNTRLATDNLEPFVGAHVVFYLHKRHSYIS